MGGQGLAEGTWTPEILLPHTLPFEFQPRHDPSVPVQTHKLGGGRVNTHNCIKLPGPPNYRGPCFKRAPDYTRDLTANNSTRVFFFSGHVDSWMKLADGSERWFHDVSSVNRVIFDEALQIDGPSRGWKNLELESCKHLWF